MPIYEYQCQTCHRTLEKRQKFSDPELTECPFCGGHLEKQISAPAIQFKGGGWYADGYGNKAAAKAGSSEGTASSDSSTSGSPDSAAAPSSSSDASSSSKASTSTDSGSSAASSASSASTPASTPSSTSTPAK